MRWTVLAVSGPPSRPTLRRFFMDTRTIAILALVIAVIVVLILVL